ncbi:helix-turn-helix domain-containing protein [Streptomyces griseocarneus]|nr:helix-turn-helix domain-containing protein [Streptomyces griseocarneus]
MPPRPSGVFLFLGVVLVRLLTVDEVADFLGVPKSWVYGNWRDQKIPFKKVGQGLRVRPSDLEKWFEGQEAA